MSDERIDIEINDKIAASIPTKLEQIAAGATKGQSAVQRLKSELASINDTPTRKLAEATDSSAAAINRELNAQRSLKGARDAGAAAAEREASAQARIASVVDRGIARYEQQAAAARAAYDASAAGEARLVGSRATAAAQAAQLRSQTEQLAAARRAEAAAAKIEEGAIETNTNALKRNSQASGLARQHQLNLFFQLQDIVVGLTSGQKPLTVFLQQGAQIQGIMRQGEIGVLGLTRAIAGMVAPFLAVIAPALILAGVFKGIKDNAASDAELKKFAAGLGLTRQEMKQLKDVTVTWGDVFGGVMDTIAQRLGTTTSKIKSGFKNAFDTIIDFCKFAAAFMYGALYSVVKTLIDKWKLLPAAVGSAAIAAANAAIDAFTDMVNFAVKGINLLIDGGNKFGLNISHVAEASAKHLADPFAKAGKEVNDALFSNLKEGMGQAYKFFDDASANASKRARARIAAQAKDIIADRTPKKDKKEADPKTKSDYLDDTNLKLDNELARMRELKDAREEQARLDQIQQEYQSRRMPLSEKELQQFREKIHAIQEFKYQQAEMDRIYEASTGPLRTYNASIAAANDLLKRGKISQADFTAEVTRATRAYKEATDPLFQMKEAMGQAERALGTYGAAAQQAAYYEQIRQAYLAKNIELSPQYVAGVNAEVDALMKRNAALQQGQFVQQQIQQVVDPLKQDQMLLQNKQAMYDELARLRQTDYLNEEQYARAKYALDAKFSEMRLAGARNFFGTLAGLSSSGNKKLAAIGKAAAVAQATIDGFVAVQKALASAPPPWNFIQAAAVGAMTGVQVAGILSTNVGSFEHGGAFMVDGRAGVDNNNINMNVSRGERVTIETPAQQRANAAANGGSGEPPVVNVKSVTVFDPKHMLDVMETAEGERVFMNIVERRANEMNRILG